MTAQQKRSLAVQALLAAGLLACLAFLALAPGPGALPGDTGFFGPRSRPLSATVSIALYWATAANALLLVALLAASRVWLAQAELVSGPASPDRSRLFWVGLLAAVALAGGLRWNLAHAGLWADEAWSVKYTMAGHMQPVASEPPRLMPRTVSWQETFWQYRKPTNHPTYSVAGRLSNAAWQQATGQPSPAFDEFALRVPAFVASLLAVLTIGLLVHAWGFPLAALAAAFLLAVHPWHVRFGGDGRAYGLVVLLTAVATLALTRGLQAGRTRYWVLFGACQWLLVWTHLFAYPVALCLGAAGLIGLLAREGPRRDRLVHAARFAVANLLAAGLFMQLMAPNLAQLPGWENVHTGGVTRGRRVDFAGVGHLWTLAATGIPARKPEVPEDDASYPGIAEWAADSPWVYAVVLLLIPALVLTGVLRVATRRGPGRLPALALAAAVPLGLAIGFVQQVSFYPRFAAFGLVPVVAFAAIGVEGLLARVAGRVPASTRRAGILAAGLVLTIAAYQVFVWPQTRLLLTRPQAPTRELVEWLARETGDEPGAAIRAGLGLGARVPQIYDPWLRAFEDPPGLRALCDEAVASGKPLYVYVGYPDKNRRKRGDAMALLDDPRLFREVARLEGIEVQFVYRVLRYSGAPIGPGPS